MRSDPANTSYQRKSWMAFDLSNDSIDFSTLSSVTLEMTVAEMPSVSSCGRNLRVYAMPTTATWPSPLTWNSGPSNNTSSAWAFNSATQIGSVALPCQEAVGSKVTVTLDANYFKNDSDKKVILGLSLARTPSVARSRCTRAAPAGPR